MKQEPFRKYNQADAIIGHIDKALNNIFCPQTAHRAYPAADAGEDRLSIEQKKKAAGTHKPDTAYVRSGDRVTGGRTP